MSDDGAMRSALEAVFQNKLSISQVVEQLPAWHISFNRMLDDVLTYSWIWVGSDLVTDSGESVFEMPLAKQALALISDLAATKKTQKLLVEYLCFNAYSVDWLQAAVPHLPITVLSDLVLRGDPDYLFGGEPTTGDLIIQFATGEIRTSIAQGAAESGRLMEMLKKTNWQECRQQSQGAMRDTIIAYDLGL